jgi:hypothetical protein
MSRKLLFGSFGTLLAGLLTLTLVSAPDLFAGSATTVNGKINTIDPVKRKVGIKLSDGSAVTLKVPFAARITRNGSGTGLGNLVLRDAVIAKYDSTTKNAAILTASGPKVARNSGQVKNAAKFSGILKIGLKSFKTDANTMIARNGTVVSLGQLTRKDKVAVHIRPGTFQKPLALDIVGCGPDESGVDGTISGIDTVAGTVTIKPENGTPDVILTVDANTIIEVNDQPATLAGLLINMDIEAEYNPSTLVAFSIQAETPENEGEVKGTVAAVDTTLGTITINPSEGGAPIILNVTAATEIEVNDASATLADILVGMPVRAKYDTTTLVAGKIEAGEEHKDDDEDVSDVEGIVTAVSANSVTIAPEGDHDEDQQQCGEPITLIIDASTEIRIGENVGTINDILVGLKIEAEYDHMTLIAKRIQIGTEGDHHGD